MASKFAFITGASENYLGSLNALLNSLEEHGHKEDFILVSFRLPKEYLEKIKTAFSFNIRVIESENEHQVEGTAYERFRHAYEIGKEYEAICLLDADQFLTDNVERFFYAASKGVIVTGSNGMLINFNEEYQKQYDVDLGVKEYPYYLTHTTCPIFLNRDDLDWFETLYKARRVSSFDDFLYLNILGIMLKKNERMICMPPYFFTQIHHFGIKPNTRIIRKEGVLLSETEERIAMIHGKWADEGWYTGLMMPMDGYFKDNHFTEYQKEQALESREIVLQEFLKYCYLGKLDLREFKRIGWLEEKLKT